MVQSFSMAHRQKLSVKFISQLLAKRDPQNLPVINSYISGNRKDIVRTEKINLMLKEYDPCHYVRQIHRKLSDHDMPVLMAEILEGVDQESPEEITKLRDYRRNNEDYDLAVDVELENLIIKAIRQNTKEEHTLLIFENLMMVYHDEELAYLYEQFKLKKNPKVRAVMWCDKHLDTGVAVQLLTKYVDTANDEQP